MSISSLTSPILSALATNPTLITDIGTDLNTDPIFIFNVSNNLTNSPTFIANTGTALTTNPTFIANTSTALTTDPTFITNTGAALAANTGFITATGIALDADPAFITATGNALLADSAFVTSATNAIITSGNLVGIGKIFDYAQKVYLGPILPNPYDVQITAQAFLTESLATLNQNSVFYFTRIGNICTFSGTTTITPVEFPGTVYFTITLPSGMKSDNFSEYIHEISGNVLSTLGETTVEIRNLDTTKNIRISSITTGGQLSRTFNYTATYAYITNAS